MKKIVEALLNAQGWAQEACRLLELAGAKKEAAAVAKALRQLRRVETDIFLLHQQKEEMINLLAKGQAHQEEKD